MKKLGAEQKERRYLRKAHRKMEKLRAIEGSGGWDNRLMSSIAELVRKTTLVKQMRREQKAR